LKEGKAMTDQSSPLHETLELLCQQLEEAENIDRKLADQLAATIRTIQEALEDENAEAATHSSLLQRLTDAARHFEESHPTLSGTLGRLVDTLGQMGI
jgi:hypothetical protein